MLGITSLLTDVSSEMVATILPLYLVFTLGFTPLQFGVVDGYQRGASALVSLGGGLVADRRRRHKEVATAGYGLSAVCKLGYVAAGTSFAALGAVVFVDRIGKGIRTAPRDALISLSSRREGLGLAFGVHRALDTTGAMLGPLAAFALLAISPEGYDAIFIVSFLVAAAPWVRGRPPGRRRRPASPTPTRTPARATDCPRRSGYRWRCARPTP
ncbi:MAG: MFS transporter [Thermoleophilia bacterium]